MSRTITIAADLRAEFGAARNQGQRPTCLAFAVSDVHAGTRAGWAPLSCEYLFFHAQRRAGRPPSRGAPTEHLLLALQQDGQPRELGWPYLAETPDAANWKPPEDVGECFSRESSTPTGTFEVARQLLDAGQPAVLLIKLSQSFYRPAADGVVVSPASEQIFDSVRHAVVAVAHGEIDGKPALLIRNSWDDDWGIGGHAWLTQQFLAPRLFGMLALGAESHVHPDPFAA